VKTLACAMDSLIL